MFYCNFLVCGQKMMLTFVAIVASIATVNAALSEYPDLRVPFEYNDNRRVIAASLINAEVTRALYRQVTIQPEVVFLLVDRMPGQPQGNDLICGPSLGVNLNNGQVIYCRINRIEVEGTKLTSGNYGLRFVLYFALQTPMSLSLITPVYKRPSRFEAEGQEQAFNDWAAEQKVGTLFAMSAPQLVDICRGSTVGANFLWLNELLSLGVIRINAPREDQDGEELNEVPDMEKYLTRPLVFSDDMSEKLLDFVYWLEDANEDWIHLPL